MGFWEAVAAELPSALELEERRAAELEAVRSAVRDAWYASPAAGALVVPAALAWVDDRCRLRLVSGTAVVAVEAPSS